ncbi:MAG: hypothetical protein KJ799_01555 [Bacteroidetes bacterium]|nr:hypothetical protein [Bacteroidota bacterium]MBU2505398.1 hypothetical protein [Bacteroidota bacterium]
MSYKVILLDADDTLFDYPKGEIYALEKSFMPFLLDKVATSFTSFVMSTLIFSRKYDWFYQ